MSAVADRFSRLSHPNLVIALVFVGAALVFPFFFDSGAGQMQTAVQALAYIAMALGLNLIVGFAGLLDLGYVAFFALGAYTMGWLGSGFFSGAGGGEGVAVLVTGPAAELPGVHINFLLIVVAAIVITTIAGMVIGLPTLRLRGDYIAIVTLAFGEIVGRIAINGDQIGLPGTAESLTAGRQGITPVDKIQLPFLEQFQSLDLRPWYFVALAMVVIVLIINFQLRDSRLGRAWVAMREDEVAAVSMGVPLVKTKLLAYGTGAAFGGVSGAFLASFLNTVNADQFQFSFSIFILAMVILGGLASIWGSVVGAIALAIINFYLIPDVFRDVPSKIGLDFDLTELSFGIFGFLLVIMMVLRPEGLIPERRRRLELTEGIGTGATTGVGAAEPVVEARG